MGHLNQPRKHHYVPVFYQNRFLNENGLLWVYDRHIRTYRELHPRVICCEKDLYTYRREGAPSDRRVETEILQAVDSMGAAALSRLSYNQVERKALSYFIAFQHTRLPSAAQLIIELHERVASEVMQTMAASVERMKSVLEDYARNTGEAVDVSAESMVEAVQGNHIVVTANKTVALRAIAEQAEHLAAVLDKMSWEIIEAAPDAGFITCDNPVTVVPPKGTKDVGFGVPGAVTYFPLTRRLCLRVCGQGPGLDSRGLDRETVRVINRNIAAHSERFVMGPIKRQIETIVAETGTTGPSATPRFIVDTKSGEDEGSLQVTVQPGNYFYVDDGQIA